MKGFLYALLFVAIAVFAQTTAGTFVFADVSKPDMVLVIVVWVALRLAFNEGVLLAFCAGLLMDNLSGAPTGLFAFVYCLSFLAIAYLNSTADLDAGLARFLMSFLLCLSQGVAILLIRSLSEPVGFGPYVAKSLFLKALFTGTAAVLIIPLLDRFWTRRPKLKGLLLHE